MQFWNGWWKTRIPVVLTGLLLSLLLFTPAAAQSPIDVFENRAVFNVPDPPDAPYMAHQSLLLFVPGAVAPLHQHGGPGYINILEGEVTLYENGEPTIYRAGDQFIETSDKLYKGINHTDEDMILMVTYLIPEGEEVTTYVDDPDQPEQPENLPVVLATTMQEFSNVPDSFDLVHATATLAPDAPGEILTASGATLLTVASGNLDVSVTGNDWTLAENDSIMIERNQEYIVQSNGDDAAHFMTTEIIPDVHGIVPAAGSTVDRTFATWLIVLTASALLVVGGVLRFGAGRVR